MQDKIIIKGAREHNLKNINVEIPRDKITVITGLSGSGKSTLAFDTLYAEGQRRYVESLSPYARQFLGIMNKPDVDSIEGLSPAISIDQKTTSRNPRSTVGTVTEIYDYLRLLYARVGIPHCPICKKAISKQGPDEIAQNLFSTIKIDEKIEILAPIARGEKGRFEKEFEKLKKTGLYNIYVNGELISIEQDLPKYLDKNKKQNICAVIDKVILKPDNKERLHEAIESALKEGNGVMIARIGTTEKSYSRKNACPEHGISLGEIQPRDFSFNSPFGACAECHGLGFKMEFDVDLIIPDKTKSIIDGAIVCYGRLMEAGWRLQQIREVAINSGIEIDEPVSKIPKERLDILLYGSKDKIQFRYESKRGSTYEYERNFEGIIPQLERLYHQTESEGRKEEIAKYMREEKCPKCKGKRLKDEMLSVLVGEKNIMEICDMPINLARKFLNNLNSPIPKRSQEDLTQIDVRKDNSNLRLKPQPEENHMNSGVDLPKRLESQVATPILKEINSRLEFLENVGLNYLTVSRESATLSGGESQRIRLATQIGANLTGIVYVLDEPSIGLHQRDNSRLLGTLKKLRDLGNTLVVVEHDEETMFEADHIIDMGPYAGVLGGEVVAQGKVNDIINNPKSITGLYLSGKKSIAKPESRRKSKQMLEIIGASENNLKNIDVSIPLGIFVCISGVSGSGKSSLINDIVYPRLSFALNGTKLREGKHRAVKGMQYLDKIIQVDQSPIGRTPRSNPATYVGLFTPIRDLFANTPESKARGYSPGRFSFNVAEGRCDNCEGDGMIKIEMHFLADVYVMCEVCKGKRYNSQTLEVNYKGKNISEILGMSVDEAHEFFQNIPSIANKLQTIKDVGLGYIKLGQSATTLSGGEAQRVKLATELSKRGIGNTMYLLDEPTTGLHFDDVNKLLTVLQRLVDKGNSIVVIEHNLDVLKSADWIIDLGPEGGDRGGRVVAEGTPEEVAKSGTYTAKYLGKIMEK